MLSKADPVWNQLVRMFSSRLTTNIPNNARSERALWAPPFPGGEVPIGHKSYYDAGQREISRHKARDRVIHRPRNSGRHARSFIHSSYKILVQDI